MEIKIAKESGFCFGVKKAVECAETMLADHPGETVYCLGELIHNPLVIADLESKGLICVDSIEDIPDEAILIIRAHGEPEETYKRAKEKKIKLFDSTCSCVRSIQKKARDYAAQGYTVFLVGKASHPEIVGIKGWVNEGEVIVVKNTEEATTLKHFEKSVVLAQTTLQNDQFMEVVQVLKEKTDSLIVENTICAATTKRQEEAEELSKICDTVLVLGSKKSSNTQKIYEICKKNCQNVQVLENSDERILEKFSTGGIIGIMTGASTPSWMMMEVVARMSEHENTTVDETTKTAVEPGTEAAQAMSESDAAAAAEEAANNEFMEAFEKTLVRIRNGQVLTGTVVQITDDEVCVNIGYKSDGFIPRSEFSDDPDVKLKDIVHEGDEIEVEVVKVNDGDGNVLLSHKRVLDKKAWDEFVEKADVEGQVFDATGKEVVKGGLITYIEGVRTFVPASQLSLRYVENLNDFIGQPLRLTILEIDRNKRRVVASQKKVLQEEESVKKKQIWESIHEGDIVKGIVRRLTDFGAFVDIGGIDGLVHVTEMAWGRVKHPSDIMKVGDEIDVIIKGLDPERERISLGYRELQPKPWASASERYPEGSVVEGKVVRLVPFGAFVSLEPTIDGLIHISQLDTSRVAKVEDVVKEGDIVKVKVLSVDPEAKRISLSRKEVLLDEMPPEEKAEAVAAENKSEDSQEESVEVPVAEAATATLAEFFPEMDESAEEKTEE